MVVIFFLLLLIRNVRGRFNRSIALSLFVFSFQLLNMAPLLTPYGFGQGQLSLMIKEMAELSDLSYLLDFLGLSGSGVAFIGALMTTALLINIDLNVRQFQSLMQQSETLAGLREDALRARMTREIQTLVHDLRRPLTSIQGLADVLAMLAEVPAARQYAEKIGVDAQNMDQMISEILHEDGRSFVNAADILSFAMSQVSPFSWHRHIETENDRDGHKSPPVCFHGNRIRISRALVNLMENAARAVQYTPHPRIGVKYFVEGDFLKFSVRDNGIGLSDDFVFGFSGFGSTGLGLALVQSVAENHGGSFTIRNNPNGGAEAVFSVKVE
jgi:signal transduction histidine kinase